MNEIRNRMEPVRNNPWKANSQWERKDSRRNGQVCNQIIQGSEPKRAVLDSISSAARANAAGIGRVCKPWTEAEIFNLKRLAGTMTAKEVSGILGRSIDSTKSKAQEIGVLLRRFGQNHHCAKYSDEVVEQCRLFFDNGLKASQIEKITGIKLDTVASWIKFKSRTNDQIFPQLNRKPMTTEQPTDRKTTIRNQINDCIKIACVHFGCDDPIKLSPSIQVREPAAKKARAAVFERMMQCGYTMTRIGHLMGKDPYHVKRTHKPVVDTFNDDDRSMIQSMPFIQGGKVEL